MAPVDPIKAKRFQDNHMRKNVKFNDRYPNLSQPRQHVVQQLDLLHNNPDNPWKWLSVFKMKLKEGGEFTLDTRPDSSQSQSNETAQPDRQAKVTSPTTAGQLTEPSQPGRPLKAASTTTAGQSSEPSQPDQQPNGASPTTSSKRAR
ncbi:hypothetical protein G6514_008551 [Epicoccum nigrum]|nr:hypothetical protein G6514_008551 [Epicoccum nigrum]